MTSILVIIIINLFAILFMLRRVYLTLSDIKETLNISASIQEESKISFEQFTEYLYKDIDEIKSDLNDIKENTQSYSSSPER